MHVRAEVVTEDQIPKSNKEAFRKLDKIKEKERDTLEKQARKKVTTAALPCARAHRWLTTARQNDEPLPVSPRGGSGSLDSSGRFKAMRKRHSWLAIRAPSC